MSDRAVGGSDTFAFSGAFGDTRIHDFEKGKDHLEIDIDLKIAPSEQVSWEKVGSDTIVTVEGPVSEGEIVLVGFTGKLNTGDFYFV